MKKYISKIVLVLLHLAFWMVVGYIFTGKSFSTPKNDAVLMGGFIVGTYINAYFLMPRLLDKQFLPLYIISVFVLTYVMAGLSGRFIHSQNAIGGYGIVYFIFFFVTSCLIIVWKFYQNSLKIKNLQNLQTETELKFLKAQINPHFLFNTLNNLYATARIESPTTATGLLKLSDLMRYMLTQANQPAVKLTDEVAYLDNYIDLEKLRLNENTRIDFVKKGDFTDKKIAPMLLLPFVENTFKHGIEALSYVISIEINLSLQGDTLYFTVQNTKINSEKDPLSIGSGLRNVRQRLEIGYPNQHGLDINETENKFNVKLWINL